jgi:DNA repair protein RecO (recombination protein O)
LRELGLLPSLQVCAGCGEPLDAGGRVAFGLLAGGVLCGRCRAGQRSVVSVSNRGIAELKSLADASDESWRQREWDRSTFGELRGLLNNYLAHVLGHRPRMHKYLGMLDAGHRS